MVTAAQHLAWSEPQQHQESEDQQEGSAADVGQQGPAGAALEAVLDHLVKARREFAHRQKVFVRPYWNGQAMDAKPEWCPEGFPFEYCGMPAIRIVLRWQQPGSSSALTAALITQCAGYAKESSVTWSTQDRQLTVKVIRLLQPEKEHQGLSLGLSSSTGSAGPERYSFTIRAVHKEQLPHLATGMAAIDPLRLLSNCKYLKSGVYDHTERNGKQWGWHDWALVENLKVDFPDDMYVCIDMWQLPPKVEASV